MCGRCGRWSRQQRIEELLGIEPSGPDDLTPLHNITPGVDTWIARAKDGKPALFPYLWGLVPYWSKDSKKGVKPVNARAETANEKPMFRKLIRKRRCLIPANCYYDWKEMSVGKAALASDLTAPIARSSSSWTMNLFTKRSPARGRVVAPPSNPTLRVCRSRLAHAVTAPV
jgi:putative SOS response-associated peptidase YedK